VPSVVLRQLVVVRSTYRRNAEGGTACRQRRCAPEVVQAHRSLPSAATRPIPSGCVLTTGLSGWRPPPHSRRAAAGSQQLVERVDRLLGPDRGDARTVGTRGWWRDEVTQADAFVVARRSSMARHSSSHVDQSPPGSATTVGRTPTVAADRDRRRALLDRDVRQSCIDAHTARHEPRRSPRRRVSGPADRRSRPLASRCCSRSGSVVARRARRCGPHAPGPPSDRTATASPARRSRHEQDSVTDLRPRNGVKDGREKSASIPKSSPIE